MMKLAALMLTLCVAPVFAQTYVGPHTRKDGTYVEGHYRSQPNGTKLDNYSTQGNSNPFTGQQGTVNPYQQPTYQAPRPQQCGTLANGQYVCR